MVGTGDQHALPSPRERAIAVEFSAFCTVDPDRSSTTIREAGIPRPTGQFRIAPASVVPACGAPPLTMIVDQGAATACSHAAPIRDTGSSRIDPSGISP